MLNHRRPRGVYYEGLDADMEMAAFEAEGRRISALNARGICTHGAGLGYKSPAIYSADDIAGDLPRPATATAASPATRPRSARATCSAPTRRDPERPMTGDERANQAIRLNPDYQRAECASAKAAIKLAVRARYIDLPIVSIEVSDEDAQRSIDGATIEELLAAAEGINIDTPARLADRLPCYWACDAGRGDRRRPGENSEVYGSKRSCCSQLH